MDQQYCPQFDGTGASPRSLWNFLLQHAVCRLHRTRRDLGVACRHHIHRLPHYYLDCQEAGARHSADTVGAYPRSAGSPHRLDSSSVVIRLVDGYLPSILANLEFRASSLRLLEVSCIPSIFC